MVTLTLALLDSFESSRMAEPYNVSGHGYRMGLAVVLDADVSDYAVTNGKFDGFKVSKYYFSIRCFVIMLILYCGIQVLIHDPAEFADVADRGFVMGPGSET